MIDPLITFIATGICILVGLGAIIIFAEETTNEWDIIKVVVFVYGLFVGILLTLKILESLGVV